MTMSKDRLRQLVEDLPDSEIAVAERVLTALRDAAAAAAAGDPVLRMLEAALLDDEPLTGGDAAAIAEGRAQYRAGKGRTLGRPATRRAHP